MPDAPTPTTARLLACWTAIPECRPPRLYGPSKDGDFSVACSGNEVTLTDTEAHAIAGDGIERWLLKHRGPFMLAISHTGTGVSLADDEEPIVGDSRLDALIAAAEAVNARSGK